MQLTAPPPPRELSSLPGPAGHAVVGHVPDLQRDPLGFLTSVASTYQPLAQLRFGPFTILMVNEPSAVEEVLVTRAKSFIKSLTVRRLSIILGDGLLTSDGESWRRQRKLAQPAFHRQRIATYGDQMVQRALEVAETWHDGQHVNAHAAMMELTLRVVGDTLFGIDLADEADEVGKTLEQALTDMFARVNSLWVILPDLIPTPHVVRLRRARHRLAGLVQRIVLAREARPDHGTDLLGLLLDARDDEGRGLTPKQLRDDVMTLVLAGHETTALALSWAWYLLGQNGPAEAALGEELERVLAGRTPHVDDLARLPYTAAVISEAMRLYPPAWIVEREAREDVVIGGVRVARGTTVLASQWTMHRDPRFFDDPLAFRPERWLDGLAQRLPRFAYFPFGGGPRVCIGNAFAQVEAQLLLATLAARFRLRLATGESIRPEPTITLRPHGGVPVTLEERKVLRSA